MLVRRRDHVLCCRVTASHVRRVVVSDERRAPLTERLETAPDSVLDLGRVAHLGDVPEFLERGVVSMRVLIGERLGERRPRTVEVRRLRVAEARKEEGAREG